MHLLSWFSRSIGAMHVHQQRGFNISTCDASNRFIWTGCRRSIHKAATKFCEYQNSAADTQQCLSASFVSRKQSKGPSWKAAAYIIGTYSNIAKDCWDGCTSDSEKRVIAYTGSKAVVGTPVLASPPPPHMMCGKLLFLQTPLPET